MFKYIEVSGTHYQIGEAIGESLRPEIKKSLELHFNKIRKSRKNVQNPAVKKFLKTAQQFFPRFVEELQGIANGSNEKFENILVFGLEEELTSGEHCTTVAIRENNNLFIAHNEDWDLPLPLYIVKAKPKKQVAYLSVSQAGQFPGTVAGLNEFGFAYTGNSIATRVSFSGLPKNFLLRSFLECKKISEAVKMISIQNRSLGNNSIMISKADKGLASLEWSIKKYELLKHNRFIVHANHFVSDKLIPDQVYKTSKSSRHRYEYAKKWANNIASADLPKMKKLLRTHFEKGGGVCQHGSYPTIASIIIDTDNQFLEVADGSPCEHKFRHFEL